MADRKDPKELVRERVGLVKEARALLDKAAAEKRDLSGEEGEQHDRMMTRCDEIAQALEQLANETRRARTDALVAELDRQGESRTRGQGGAGSGSPERETRPKTELERALEVRSSKEYASAFWQSQRHGQRSLLQSEYDLLRAPELRALTVGTATAGAELVPTEFERTLLAVLAETNVMRSLATVIQTAADREIPVNDALPVAGWVAEGGAVTEDDATYAQVVLGAHKGDLLTKVSEELVADSAFDMPGHLARQFGTALGTLEELAFVNGNGTGKPTGVRVGASAGVTFASATAIAADELFDLQHSLKRGYRARATWLVKDSTLKLMRKLKDSTNQYLWQPGLQAGSPDVLLGRPVAVSDGMAAATTGQISVLFGDFKYYWIADRAARNLQRLDELYRATGLIGFRMYFRTDGKVVLGEAIKKGTQA